MTSPSPSHKIVVSDSSPLIHLSQIGRLYLLRDFFESVLTPPAVHREVVVEERGAAWSRRGEESQLDNC